VLSGILPPVFALSGTLDRLHLGDLLEWLQLTRATGRLMLAAGAVTRSFEVCRGRIAFASSSRASERLASWLLRKQLAPRQALLRALAISQSRGELFTIVAEREAGVPHDTLIEAGRGLAAALASYLLSEVKILFNFDADFPVQDRLHVDLDLECRSLMLQAAYRVDTLPLVDAAAAASHATLDPETLEHLFWRIAGDLEGEQVDAAALAQAHDSFLAVGEILHRWVTQGPPLLPLAPGDVERVRARLAADEAVEIDDSPTLAWDLLSLVNGLDAPGYPRAASASEAWEMAGEDARELVRLIVENSRWRREARPDRDEALRRVALARSAAGRALAGIATLPEETGATAAALPVVLLELVATALASSPLASTAMQRCALHHLLPLVGAAAGTAAGLPEVLLAAVATSPVEHSGVRLAHLVDVAVGELGGAPPTTEPSGATDPLLKAALAKARAAAGEATKDPAGRG
jgi:hypothetical protein